jgi:hypothetical protein
VESFYWVSNNIPARGSYQKFVHKAENTSNILKVHIGVEEYELYFLKNVIIIQRTKLCNKNKLVRERTS